MSHDDRPGPRAELDVEPGTTLVGDRSPSPRAEPGRGPSEEVHVARAGARADVHLNAGRHPDDEASGADSPFDVVALVGAPREVREVDREVAGTDAVGVQSGRGCRSDLHGRPAARTLI